MIFSFFLFNGLSVAYLRFFWFSHNSGNIEMWLHRLYRKYELSSIQCSADYSSAATNYFFILYCVHRIPVDVVSICHPKEWSKFYHFIFHWTISFETISCEDEIPPIVLGACSALHRNMTSARVFLDVLVAKLHHFFEFHTLFCSAFLDKIIFSLSSTFYSVLNNSHSIVTICYYLYFFCLHLCV